jgi:predicted hydrocarbon binding protein
MKGIIFTVLNELVEEKFGLAAWQQLLDSTGDDGIFTGSGTYEDQRLFALVGALSAQSGLPVDALLRTYGEYAIPKFYETYPVFFDRVGTLREFLLSIDGIIHVEVKKLYPKVRLPKIWYDESDANSLIVNYQSDRKLCVLAEGMILGAATYFSEPVELAQSKCQNCGDDHCAIDVTFQSLTKAQPTPQVLETC